MESSKSTICKVDKRGGIFLPLSMRKAFDIAQNVRIEFSPQDDGTVVLKKLDSACFFCGEKDSLVSMHGLSICERCSNQVAALDEEEVK